MFLQVKICVSAHVSKSFAKCLFVWIKRSEDPSRKNGISGYIWHKSFIQTVKCSFFSQRFVYQSFSGASLAFSYFFFKEKFCVSACVSKSLARCLLFEGYFEAFRRPCGKMISPVIHVSDTNRSFKW